jgi:hypothetical protein
VDREFRSWSFCSKPDENKYLKLSVRRASGKEEEWDRRKVKRSSGFTKMAA